MAAVRDLLVQVEAIRIRPLDIGSWTSLAAGDPHLRVAAAKDGRAVAPPVPGGGRGLRSVRGRRRGLNHVAGWCRRSYRAVLTVAASRPGTDTEAGVTQRSELPVRGLAAGGSAPGGGEPGAHAVALGQHCGDRRAVAFAARRCRESGPFVLSGVSGLLKDSHLAGDVVQETMRRVRRHCRVSGQKSVRLGGVVGVVFWRSFWALRAGWRVRGCGWRGGVGLGGEGGVS
jgi:hypothetical protein